MSLRLRDLRMMSSLLLNLSLLQGLHVNMRALLLSLHMCLLLRLYRGSRNPLLGFKLSYLCFCFFQLSPQFLKLRDFMTGSLISLAYRIGEIGTFVVIIAVGRLRIDA